MTPNSHVNHAAVPWGRCATGKLPFADCSDPAKEGVALYLVLVHSQLVTIDGDEILDLGSGIGCLVLTHALQSVPAGRKSQRMCGGRASGVAKSQHKVSPSVEQGASA